MIHTVCPEDMIIEFATKSLKTGKTYPTLEHNNLLSYLPTIIELSEEFFIEWQKLVTPAFAAFTAHTFGLRQFLLEDGTRIKKALVTDPLFWKSVNLNFSHKAPLRVYEKIISQVSNLPINAFDLTPADALFFSLLLDSFSIYSFEWLQKHDADWLVIALFMRYLNINIDARLPWMDYLDNPAKVDLPMRDYLIEVSTSVIRQVTLNILSNIEQTDIIEEAANNYHAKFNLIGNDLKNQINNTRKLIKSLNKAIQHWSELSNITVEDERFIHGAADAYRLEPLIEKFNRACDAFVEHEQLKERLNESFL